MAASNSDPIAAVDWRSLHAVPFHSAFRQIRHVWYIVLVIEMLIRSILDKHRAVSASSIAPQLTFRAFAATLYPEEATFLPCGRLLTLMSARGLDRSCVR